MNIGIIFLKNKSTLAMRNPNTEFGYAHSRKKCVFYLLALITIVKYFHITKSRFKTTRCILLYFYTTTEYT